MGIKCFLFSLGRANVESIPLPTMNYTPEVESYFGTVSERWTQMKRHALGFSDLSYLFSVLPLLIGYVNSEGSNCTMKDLVSVMSKALLLIIKIINAHVIIGVITTYGALALVLRIVLYFVMPQDVHIRNLVTRTWICYLSLTISTVTFLVVVTLLFQVIYKIFLPRMEGRPGTITGQPFVHWVYTAVSFIAFGPLYFLFLGLATWKAALHCLVSHQFEYEVAAKLAPVGTPRMTPRGKEMSAAALVAAATLMSQAAPALPGIPQDAEKEEMEEDEASTEAPSSGREAPTGVQTPVSAV